MTEEEKRLFDAIKDFRYTQNRIADLLQRISERTYRITPTYSLAAGGGGGGVAISRVENAAMKQIQLMDELAGLQKTETNILDALHNAGLTRKEKGLVECTMCGYSLAEYARIHGIYISNVYKIRDKSIEKMIYYLKHKTK